MKLRCKRENLKILIAKNYVLKNKKQSGGSKEKYTKLGLRETCLGMMRGSGRI